MPDFTASDVVRIQLSWGADVSLYDSIVLFGAGDAELATILMDEDGTAADDQADEYAIALAAYQDAIAPAPVTIVDNSGLDRTYAETIAAYIDQPFDAGLLRPVTPMWERNPLLIATDPYFEPYPRPALTEIPGATNQQQVDETFVFQAVAADAAAPAAPSPAYSAGGAWQYLGDWSRQTPGAIAGMDVWAVSLHATRQLDDTWLVVAGAPVQITDGAAAVPLAAQFSPDGIVIHTSREAGDIYSRVHDTATGTFGPWTPLVFAPRVLLASFAPLAGPSSVANQTFPTPDRSISEFRYFHVEVDVVSHSDYAAVAARYGPIALDAAGFAILSHATPTTTHTTDATAMIQLTATDHAGAGEGKVGARIISDRLESVRMAAGWAAWWEVQLRTPIGIGADTGRFNAVRVTEKSAGYPPQPILVRLYGVI